MKLLGTLTLTLLLLATACSSVDAPRWAQEPASATTRTFDSPRVEYLVEADPDIGNVTFRGTGRGREPVQVFAAEDGRVLEVFFARGDTVTSGDDVLVFLSAPSEAELIALEIARLEIERAVARSAPADDIAALEDSRQALADSYDERTQIISAPTTGVIGTTRQNIEYSVTQDSVLFELSDPGDVVVELLLSVRDLAAFTPGAPVVMSRTDDAGADLVSGTIAELPATDGLAETAGVVVTVLLDDPASVALGDRLLVALPVEAGADSRWIPLEAIGRQAGSSFVLIADDGSTGNELRRLDVRLGRRTLSHVQVLEGLEVGMRLVATS